MAKRKAAKKRKTGGKTGRICMNVKRDKRGRFTKTGAKRKRTAKRKTVKRKRTKKRAAGRKK